MGRIIFVCFILFLFAMLDLYTYYGMSGLWSNPRHQRNFRIVYIVLSVLTYLAIILLTYFFATKQMGHRTEFMNFLNGFVFAAFIAKLCFGVVMLLQDGTRTLLGGIQYLTSLFSEDATKEVFIPERRKFITTAGTFAAAVPFFSILYGITKGKYRYTVEKIIIESADLPIEFDGFSLVQISDIHAGSFDNKEKVMAGIQKINDLNADVVCFTGDLVNSEKEEILPYIEVFGKIQANMGKFAVLGNHDYYGTYNRNDAVATKAYYDDFFLSYDKMGFQLLNNRHISLTRGNAEIRLIGVENWGAGRWFPKNGDLDLASRGLKNGDFSILLSHDPPHWDQKVISHSHHVHLTLSGHTHGFQFGFQMPGFKWSPAQYRYRHWAGLYQENDKYLYVNRGFGFLGFPGRVGMWPEITHFTFRRKLDQPELG